MQAVSYSVSRTKSHVPLKVPAPRLQGRAPKKDVERSKFRKRLFPLAFLTILITPFIDQNFWLFKPPPAKQLPSPTDLLQKIQSLKSELVFLQETEESFQQGIRKVLSRDADPSKKADRSLISRASILQVAKDSLSTLKAANSPAYYEVRNHQDQPILYVCKTVANCYIAMCPSQFKAMYQDKPFPCVGKQSVTFSAPV